MNDAYLIPTREELILRDRAHKDAELLASYMKYQDSLLEDAVQIYTERMNIKADSDGKWQPLGTSLTTSRNDELLYQSEADLQKIRLCGRRLVNFNPFAINCVASGQSYIVGTGHTYRIKRKEGVTPDQLSDDMLARCREIVAQFEKRNIWSQRQDETWMRGERDGDVLRRLFITDSDLSVRFVEPEQLRNPMNLAMDDTLFNAVQYGVRFKRIDTTREEGRVRSFVDYESPESYYVHPITSNTPLTANVGDDYDELKAFSPETRAGELQHIKFNVDLAAPRGVSTFWAIEEFLDRAVMNLRNMSTMIGMRASIAWIRKHAHANKATIQAYVANAADAAVTNTLTGKTLNYRQWRPGSVIDANADTTYDFPPVTDPTGVVAGVQAELRAAASRVQYPEFMFTSDSSNSNYSSVLVAEGPAVKKFEKCQQRMVEWDKPLLELQFALKAKAGELPRNILDLIDISADTPRVKTRNLGEEVTAGIQQIEAGLASKAEIAGELGREFEKSKAGIEEETKWQQEMDKKYPPPAEPGAPGAPPSKPAEPAAQEPPAKPTKTAPEIEEPDGGDVGEGQDLDEEQHTYSSLLAEVPLTISKAVLAVSQFIPAGDLAEKGREYLPHITVKYGFPFDDPAPVLQALRGQAPITATLGTVSLFRSDPANPKPYDVVKVDVASPDLESLHQRLTATLPNVVMYAEYHPHLTLAYVKPGAGDKYDGMSPFAGTKITIDSLLFSDRAGTQIRIPLPPLELLTQQASGAAEVFSPETLVGTVQESTPDLTKLEHLLESHPGGWEVIDGMPVYIEPLQDLQEINLGPYERDAAGRFAGTGGMAADKGTDGRSTMFHGTTKSRLESILKKGLVPYEGSDAQAHYGFTLGDGGITPVFVLKSLSTMQPKKSADLNKDSSFYRASQYAVSTTGKLGGTPVVLILRVPASVKIIEDDYEGPPAYAVPKGIPPEYIIGYQVLKAVPSDEPDDTYGWYNYVPDGEIVKLREQSIEYNYYYVGLVVPSEIMEDIQEANPYHDHLGRFASGPGGMAADKDMGGGSGKRTLKKVPATAAAPAPSGKKTLKKATAPAVPNSASKTVSGHKVYRVHYQEPYPKPQPPPSVPRNATPEEKRARKPLMEAHRAELAQWEDAVAAQGGLWLYDSGKAAPKHIQEFGLSKTDMDVYINPDPQGHLAAHGWHAKADGSRADKPFHRYNDDHKVRARVGRNARSDAVLENVDAFMDRIEQDRRSPDPQTRDSAAALHLMMISGMRVGNPESRKGYWKDMDVIDPISQEPMKDDSGKKIKERVFIQTFGASTIQAGHVQRSPAPQTRTQIGDTEDLTTVHIRKGQVYVFYRVQKALKVGFFPIEDDDLAAELMARKKAAANSTDLIFPNTSDSKIRGYMKSTGASVGIEGADELKVKDIRLAHGTSVALRVRDEISQRLFGSAGPQTQADVDRFMDAISIEIARALKNTPAMAKQKYANWWRVLDGLLPPDTSIVIKESFSPET